MAKKMYIGVDDKAKLIKNVYVGVNGVAQKVKKVYVGVNDVAMVVYAGEQKIPIIVRCHTWWSTSWRSVYNTWGYVTYSFKCNAEIVNAEDIPDEVEIAVYFLAQFTYVNSSGAVVKETGINTTQYLSKNKTSVSSSYGKELYSNIQYSNYRNVVAYTNVNDVRVLNFNDNYPQDRTAETTVILTI